MTADEPPLWRSLLYVPVTSERFVAGAGRRGADAVILDLEDSIPPDRKAAARAALPGAVDALAGCGSDIVVRVNAELRHLAADIEAAVRPGVDALCLPKVRSADHVRLIAELVDALERERELPAGRISFIVLIETLDALGAAGAIAAAHARVAALSLGDEDFATDAGIAACEATLAGPKQAVVFAAHRHRRLALGTLDTIADFGDVDGYAALAARSRRFGFDGAPCIHPTQVAPLNAAFTPSADEAAEADAVLAAFAAAAREGRGAVAAGGRMIDAPAVVRARAVQDRLRRIGRKADAPR
ncbi:CoA ester lyase [Acuticoccus sp. I52.16.1]|uniref:HpcH/HpaI aldolase/citrate lyase family protein n=1 Tax=Acuticoccus sp. I52.16.1 TaxID=2928472 RepID=UPI001FD3E713|nr:aldolase/citrate lyase family protein [Acuticoccus sp. I52.16.1]UOM33111.1 aldolase/citrate lyase family protein [Acuticoccus sp. I52.16.1]